MSEALKPCSYCGGEANIGCVGTGHWWIECQSDECNVCLEPLATKEKAIKAWNTRPGEQAAYEAGVQAGRAAERGRIVTALEAEMQSTIKLAVEELGNVIKVNTVYNGKGSGLRRAIAIAREEGGG